MLGDKLHPECIHREGKLNSGNVWQMHIIVYVAEVVSSRNLSAHNIYVHSYYYVPTNIVSNAMYVGV